MKRRKTLRNPPMPKQTFEELRDNLISNIDSCITGLGTTIGELRTEKGNLQAQVFRLEAEVEEKGYVIEGLAELCHLLNKEIKQLGKTGLVPINKFGMDSPASIIEYFTIFAHAKAEGK